MNNAEKILEIIADGLESGKNYLGSEYESLLVEYTSYHIISKLSWVLFSAAALMISGFISYIAYNSKHNKEYMINREGWATLFNIPFVISIFFTIMLLFNSFSYIDTYLKLKNSPRIFLIKDIQRSGCSK